VVFDRGVSFGPAKGGAGKGAEGKGNGALEG